MAKKLYYNDPLKAAIMARDFGVTYDAPKLWDMFSGIRLQLKAFPKYSLGNEVELTLENSSEDIKYYIHPDSYHIFEPQEGDMDSNRNLYSAINGWHSGGAGDEGSIIQRNNKHFFMPEVEDE